MEKATVAAIFTLALKGDVGIMVHREFVTLGENLSVENGDHFLKQVVFNCVLPCLSH